MSLGWSGQWLAQVEQKAEQRGVSAWVGLGGQRCDGAPGSTTRVSRTLVHLVLLHVVWLRSLSIAGSCLAGRG